MWTALTGWWSGCWTRPTGKNCYTLTAYNVLTPQEYEAPKGNTP
jgi:hypothetical protein